MRTTKESVRKYSQYGVVINCLLFAMTTPLINIYFIQKVSTTVFSIVNWTSIIIYLVMAKFLKNQRNREIIQKSFLYLIIIDTALFIIVSFMGMEYINIRFFGLAVLNGTTTAMWMCVMKSNINKVFISDELTNFQTHQDYLASIAQLLGATIAIILTRLDVSVNILMFVQIVASTQMGIYDYKIIKIIERNDKLNG